MVLSQLMSRLWIFFKSPRLFRRGSPLVEESILLGLSLFAFMILATIVFDLVEFARSIFDDVTNGLDRFP